MPATHRPLAGRVAGLSRGVLRGLRHADDELMRASAAMIRIRVPRSQPRTHRVKEPVH